MAWHGIALAMVIEPEILFLDEPAASFDKSKIGIIEEIILGMKKEGRIIVIMTTHDARQAELLADTLIQIKGKIVLTQGMVDLGLLHGEVDGLIESETYKRFYMHRTGHWLGMDVHDAGEYKLKGEWRPLVPGMTLTVEPGLYIRPADDVPAALWNIGIRIEDDVAVTETGCEVLTHPPKIVAEIEDAMHHE